MRRINWRVFAVLLIIIGLFVALEQVYPNQRFRDALRSPSQLIEEESDLAKDGSLARIGAVNFANAYIRDHPERMLFGGGLGAASPSFISFAAGDIYEEYSNLRPFRLVYSRILLEVGIIGAIAFAAIYFAIGRMSLRGFSKEEDPLWQAIFFLCAAFTFLLFISIFYTNWLGSDPVMFTYWTIAAIIYRRSRLSGLARLGR